MTENSDNTRPEVEIVEKSLDISDGEESAEVTLEVPPDRSGHDTLYYKYTVTVAKEKMTTSLLNNTFNKFWAEVEEAVMEDVNEV